MANQRHLKNKDMSLSYLQERILDALYMLALNKMYLHGAGEYSGAYRFKGRAIAAVIGGAWSTFRRREMDKLMELQWIEKESVTGIGWVYWLTQTGFGALHSRIIHASQHSQEVYHDDSIGQMPLAAWAQSEEEANEERLAIIADEQSVIEG